MKGWGAGRSREVLGVVARGLGVGGRRGLGCETWGGGGMSRARACVVGSEGCPVRDPGTRTGTDGLAAGVRMGPGWVFTRKRQE